MNDPTGSVPDVGSRIKQIRMDRNLSIRAVARMSGISINALSRIERNLSSPSVSTLYKIAQAMDVPLVSFFKETSSHNPVVFCKKEQSVKIPFLRGLWEGLACEKFAGGIEPFLLTLEAGGGSGRFLMHHSGDEFVYCLEGQIEYEVEKERYLLEAGDSLMFLAHRDHRWRNAGKEPCRALIILFDQAEKLKWNEAHFIQKDLTQIEIIEKRE